MKFSLILTFIPPDDYLPLAKAADEEGWHSVNVVLLRRDLGTLSVHG